AHLLTARMRLSGERYADPARQIAFTDRLLESLRDLPGVEGAATGNLPPGEGHATNGIGIEASPLQPQNRVVVAGQLTLSAGYFGVRAIPLLAGRGILESDAANALPIVVVSDTFARRFFPGESAAGKRIRVSKEDPWRTIVGVVGDIKTAGLTAAPEPV